MTARLIDGKHIAAECRKALKLEIDQRLASGQRAPGLAVILVGDDPASKLYINKKIQACKQVGLVSGSDYLSADISEADLLALIDQYNADDTIDGILVQLPLPDHINDSTVIERIRPDKDVDGFHPYNVGRLPQRIPLLRACTPLGIMRMLEHIEQPIRGRKAVVVGASNIVGRPMALELLCHGATVTVCHRFTQDLAAEVAEAELLVVGVGKAGLIHGD